MLGLPCCHAVSGPWHGSCWGVGRHALLAPSCVTVGVPDHRSDRYTPFLCCRAWDSCLLRVGLQKSPLILTSPAGILMPQDGLGTTVVWLVLVCRSPCHGTCAASGGLVLKGWTWFACCCCCGCGCIMCAVPKPALACHAPVPHLAGRVLLTHGLLLVHPMCHGGCRLWASSLWQHQPSAHQEVRLLEGSAAFSHAGTPLPWDRPARVGVTPH